MLAPEAAADNFFINAFGQLVDITDGDGFLAKNGQDLFAFQLLKTKAASKNVPLCSACGGTLQCNYPGTTGNTFAMCFGYLALGPPDVFGTDPNNGNKDCERITLHFK